MYKAEKNSNIVFYRCSVCGNLMIKLVDSGLTPQCCGRDMMPAEPSKEEFGEKHIPVWRMNGCKLMIQVGEILHPMSKEHYINWILIKTNLGTHIRELSPDDSPEAVITLSKGERLLEVYSFCNIHGLWMDVEYGNVGCDEE